jgi:hypothetical protein
MSLFAGSSMCDSRPDEAVLARLLEHLVQHLQQLAVRGLANGAGLEQAEHRGERALSVPIPLATMKAPSPRRR